MTALKTDFFSDCFFFSLSSIGIVTRNWERTKNRKGLQYDVIEISAVFYKHQASKGEFDKEVVLKFTTPCSISSSKSWYLSYASDPNYQRTNKKWKWLLCKTFWISPESCIQLIAILLKSFCILIIYMHYKSVSRECTCKKTSTRNINSTYSLHKRMRWQL